MVGRGADCLAPEEKEKELAYLDPPTVPNVSLLAGFIDGKAQI